MKAFLMHPDRDFDLKAGLPSKTDALIQDLGLKTLFDAMARGDAFLYEVAEKAVLFSLNDPEAITYRQAILQDCLAHPSVIREVYAIALEAIQGEKKEYFGVFSRSPDLILHRSVRVLTLFVGALKKLRQVIDEQGGGFRSRGLTRLVRMLQEELSDAYFQVVQNHLSELKFKNGVLISAKLGKGNKGVHYVLRRPREERPNWVLRLLGQGRPSYSFEIAPRDEGGHRALTELSGRGINLVANTLAQSTDHILSFFTMLRTELAFYIGCLNLQEAIAAKGKSTCIPVPLAAGVPRLSAQGLYDVCLALTQEGHVVGNDLAADGKQLVMITGANQGGKSTFLRSLGLAQLMLQSGMFVAAERFSADVVANIFTHFKREEDLTMKSGKLDEELSRMSEIADHLHPPSLLLFNESFASTNEREGSEIARQVIGALMEAGVKVIFVTHLFDLAESFHHRRLDTALFLRAERRPDGRRTFRIVEGEPLPTSYGEDLYRDIFVAERKDEAALPADRS